MNSTNNNARFSFLVRLYVKHVQPHTNGGHVTWGERWVNGTIRFGRGLMVAGSVVLALCVFIPNDDRRWYCAGIGVITFVVGLWHARNAVAIDALARGRSHIPL